MISWRQLPTGNPRPIWIFSIMKTMTRITFALVLRLTAHMVWTVITQKCQAVPAIMLADVATSMAHIVLQLWILWIAIAMNLIPIMPRSIKILSRTSRKSTLDPGLRYFYLFFFNFFTWIDVFFNCICLIYLYLKKLIF